MLTQICQYLRNWFEQNILTGSFKVTDGVLTFADGSALPLQNEQYYRIIGSVFNWGVHQYGREGEQLIDPLHDEQIFVGAVWAMAVPPEVARISAAAAKWETDNAAAIASPYQSESFGGYSYSLKSSSDGTGGASWQTQRQFTDALAPYRKY